MKTIIHNGREFFESECNGSWWRRCNIKKPDNKFYGGEHNLPLAVLVKLAKIKRLNDYTMKILELNYSKTHKIIIDNTNK